MKKKFIPLIWVTIYLFFCLVLCCADKYAFQYIEQRQTFFADAVFLKYIFGQVGGTAIFLSDLIVQFFIAPVPGILITAALLTLASFFSADVFKKISGCRQCALLAVSPALCCISQLCDINFQFFGIVAYILFTFCLFGYVRIERDVKRLCLGALATIVLFAAAGSIAMLFAVSAFIIELFQNPKKAAMFILLPALAVLAGYVTLRTGWAAEGRQVFEAFGYYSLRLKLPVSCMATWALWGVTLIAVCVAGFIKSKKISGVIYGSLGVVAVAGTVIFLLAGINKSDKSFRELYVHAGNDDWDQIIRYCSDNSPNNLLLQNYLGIALAEKGQLASRIFDFPIRSYRGLYVESNKTPYVSALLGDVFFSIGEIGLAQRYSFEANVAFGNYSPRLLKRLTITNLAFGAYEVAEKYISLLEKTLFYKRWAKEFREMLYNDDAVAVNAVVSSKRKCIFPENKLSGLGGLDIDLKRIIRNNPEHQATIQYLGTVLLLLKDMNGFIDLMEEFYGSQALPEVLPIPFQQAISIYANGDTGILAKYNVQQEVLNAFDEFKKSPKSRINSFWFFYFFYQEVPDYQE